MTLVRQHSKKRLLMNQLGPKAVDHAHGPSAVGVKQCRVIRHDGQVFIDQQTLVNDIYLEVAGAQAAVAKLELIRRCNYRRISPRLKKFAKQLELLLRTHPFQIDDRDPRLMVRTSSK